MSRTSDASKINDLETKLSKRIDDLDKIVTGYEEGKEMLFEGLDSRASKSALSIVDEKVETIEKGLSERIDNLSARIDSLSKSDNSQNAPEKDSDIVKRLEKLEKTIF